ncbi:MAG: hypothetical protein JW936_02980 [Sedimentisphaerales bacterium]|nr:hypothetical protein [Sedimentisphaerales bacterium]
MDLRILCDLVQGAARRAGDYALSHLGSVGHELKSESQLVTEIDRESQAMILAEIEPLYSRAGVLAEEGPDGDVFRKPPGDGGDCYWVIDPIDGTRNYAYGLPFFCVSVALMRGGRPVIGVIYVPVTREMFYAWEGGGAYCNGEAIRCSDEGLHGNSMIALPGRQRGGVKPFALEVFHEYVYQGLGSAALHYAYVAKGCFAGTCSWEVKLWDIAAGAVIVTEAGGKVSSVDGNEIFPIDCGNYRDEILEPVAGGAAAYKQMLEILAKDR